MKTPGIEVHPILILGDQHHVNSVTMTDVRVPVANRIGEENEGWTYAKGLLTHERTGIAGVARSQVQIAQLKRIAAETALDNAPAHRRTDVQAQDRRGRNRTDGARSDRAAHARERGAGRCARTRVVDPEDQRHRDQPAHRDLTVEAYGYYGVPYPQQRLIDNEGPIGPELAVAALKEMLFGRASSIFGGSNEIQKNIISKAVLGL